MSLLNKITFVFIFLYLCFLTGSPIYGAHIVGGEMTYSCLGNDIYRLQLKLYRDASSGGAEFDGTIGATTPFATISIFEGLDLINVVNLDNVTINQVNPDLSNPCLILPPNINIEEGVYTFDLELPPSEQDYTITYQRCCRNVTISNLITPEDVGSTYSVSITSYAQDLCNSSPAFNELPPIIICAGFAIDFDFSASDPNGDMIEYELCSPFEGGGNNTMEPEAPLGVSPNPDLPPPYQAVNFSNPFSSNFPMNADPALSIDAYTGLLSGVPTTLGQFVVGVCIKEYRNGQLLSTITRDFQFNVTECEPLIVAGINSDYVDENGIHVFDRCGEQSINIEVLGYDQEFVETYFFEINIPGKPPLVFVDQESAEIPIGEYGSYFGRYVINQGYTCGDSLDFVVNLYHGLQSNFTFDYDTCYYDVVDFTNESTSELHSDSIIIYNWEFGDENFSNEKDPSHLYEYPSMFPVKLFIADTNGCMDSLIREINYYPAPNEILPEPNVTEGCIPLEVSFLNFSKPINNDYDLTWEISNGSILMGLSPTYTFEEAGTYDLYVEVVSPIGCATDSLFEDLITALPLPTAGFDYTPDKFNNFQRDIELTDTSIDSESVLYHILPSTITSTQRDFDFRFPDTGFYEIRQIVTHQNGCTDTSSINVDIEPIITFFLPNAFTPNDDLINDGYRGNGFLNYASGFELSIWNRYGERVFVTNDPYESWSGLNPKNGQILVAGTYIVKVKYFSPREGNINLASFLQLLK